MSPIGVLRVRQSSLLASKLVVRDKVMKRFNFVRLSVRKLVWRAFWGYIEATFPHGQREGSSFSTTTAKSLLSWYMGPNAGFQR